MSKLQYLKLCVYAVMGVIAQGNADIKIKNIPISLNSVYYTVPGADFGTSAATLAKTQVGHAGLFVSGSNGQAYGLSVSTPYFRISSASHKNISAYDTTMFQTSFDPNVPQNDSLYGSPISYSMADYEVWMKYISIATAVRLGDWVNLGSFDLSAGLQYELKWGRAEHRYIPYSSSDRLIEKEEQVLIPSLGVHIGDKINVELETSIDGKQWQLGYYVANAEPASWGLFGLLHKWLHHKVPGQRVVPPLSWGVYFNGDQEHETVGIGGGLQYWFFEVIPFRGQVALVWNAEGEADQQLVSAGTSIVLRKAHAGDPEGLRGFLDIFKNQSWLYGTEFGVDVFQDVKLANATIAIKVGRYF
jgi:hypothetical protein